ncbi:MAG: ABC transporter ATP-binding protein [Elusimicrobiota bacterium]|jgi:ABC-type glutathione transport system ATPase component|nr:ABC transporter ATP-binding protein [Elusimicrobiota bacterium]
MNILSVRNLSIDYRSSFGTVCAVKNVSFDVKKGETFTIVGRSGGGKSSIASAIMDLTTIDGGEIKSGEIFYKGQDLLKMSQAEKRAVKGKEISMIFQDPNSYLNPLIKAGRQIEESFIVCHPKASKSEIAQKIEETLERVELKDVDRIYNSYPHRLSGGQKQRILTAMAIINNPQLLIADEPTTGLDADVQKKILDLIKGLKVSLGLTVIMITHNMKVAQAYSDTVVEIKEGQLNVPQTLNSCSFHP